MTVPLMILVLMVIRVVYSRAVKYLYVVILFDFRASQKEKFNLRQVILCAANI